MLQISNIIKFMNPDLFIFIMLAAQLASLFQELCQRNGLNPENLRKDTIT